ncbi:hypothetical protein V0R60_26785, partial [Pseudomonas sp. 119P]|nr:hypothetical protein [Pseudomonas sp. 119P]
SRLDAGLTVSKENEALTINGVTFDFSRLAEGSTLPADAVGSGFVIAPVERISGRLVLTLMLPHAADASESVRFPVDIHDAADGPVHLPGLDIDPAQPIATNGVIDWSQVVTLPPNRLSKASGDICLINRNGSKPLSSGTTSAVGAKTYASMTCSSTSGRPRSRRSSCKRTANAAKPTYSPG